MTISSFMWTDLTIVEGPNPKDSPLRTGHYKKICDVLASFELNRVPVAPVDGARGITWQFTINEQKRLRLNTALRVFLDYDNHTFHWHGAESLIRSVRAMNDEEPRTP